MIGYILFCAGPNCIWFFNECPGGGGGGGGGGGLGGGGGGFEFNKILNACPVAFFKLIRSPGRRLLMTYM